MSRPTEHSISCKGCGRQQQFTTWESLNVTLDPERKQKLIKGELTRFVCEKCGWSSEVLYPLLYHDMQKQLMIWLVPAGGQSGADELSLGGLMKDYRLRLVSTRNELIEKILIFDSELDDRVIEFFKLLLQAQSFETNRPLSGLLLFVDVMRTGSGEEMVRFDHLMEQGGQSVELPIESYNHVRNTIARKLPAAESEKGKWLRVDLGYAKSLLGPAEG